MESCYFYLSKTLWTAVGSTVSDILRFYHYLNTNTNTDKMLIFFVFKETKAAMEVILMKFLLHFYSFKLKLVQRIF